MVVHNGVSGERRTSALSYHAPSEQRVLPEPEAASSIVRTETEAFSSVVVEAAESIEGFSSVEHVAGRVEPFLAGPDAPFQRRAETVGSRRAVGQIGARVQCRHARCQPLGLGHAIAVRESEEFALARSHPRRACHHRAFTGPSQHPYRTAGDCAAGSQETAPVGRTIVDHRDLEIPVRLIVQRTQQVSEQIATITHRYDHRRAWPVPIHDGEGSRNRSHGRAWTAPALSTPARQYAAARKGREWNSRRLPPRSNATRGTTLWTSGTGFSPMGCSITVVSSIAT